MISIIDNLITRINNKNNFILYLLVLSFFIVSSIEQMGLITIHYYESYLEHIQVLVIFLILILTFIYRKIFKRYYGKYILFIRLFAVSFVFYEEISFISLKLCKFCSSFNAQGEFNIHNMPFFQHTVLVSLPFIDELYLMTFIVFFLVLLLSWGKYLPFIGNIKGIFFERKLSVNGSLFIIERIFSHIVSCFSFLPFLDDKLPFLIHPEFLELHLYIVVLFDLLLKIEEANRKDFKNTMYENRFS